jgi:hypothetical protein
MSETGWPVALTGHFFELRHHQGVGSHTAAPNPSGGPSPGRRSRNRSPRRAARVVSGAARVLGSALRDQDGLAMQMWV